VTEPVVDLELQPGRDQGVGAGGDDEPVSGQESGADQPGTWLQHGRQRWGWVCSRETFRPNLAPRAAIPGSCRSFQLPSGLRLLPTWVPPSAAGFKLVSSMLLARSCVRLPTSRAMPNAIGNLCEPNLRSMSPARPPTYGSKCGSSLRRPSESSHATIIRNARTATWILPLAMIRILRRAVRGKNSAGDVSADPETPLREKRRTPWGHHAQSHTDSTCREWAGSSNRQSGHAGRS
jgi:hypothetical protein